MWITFSFNRRKWWRKNRRWQGMRSKWLEAKSRFWFHFEFTFQYEMLWIRSWFFHYFLLFDQINKQSHWNCQISFFPSSLMIWCHFYHFFLWYYRPDVCSQSIFRDVICRKSKLISVYLYGVWNWQFSNNKTEMRTKNISKL